MTSVSNNHRPPHPPESYERAVSDAMLKLYGLTWADACGDTEPLTRAQADGWTPEQFVQWFGEKYDLEPRSSYL
jgi:hypothetical protein